MAAARDLNRQPKLRGDFAGMPCQDCLAAALAVTQAPELAVQPVSYVMARIAHPPIRRLVEPRARAPPRPPGQAKNVRIVPGEPFSSP